MSTVTLSQPHWAMTSAENPEGIANQALMQALPDFRRALSLFIKPPPVFLDGNCLIFAGRIWPNSARLARACFSRPQYAAGALADFSDDLFGERLDLGVGHGLVARLHGDGDGN